MAVSQSRDVTTLIIFVLILVILVFLFDVIWNLNKANNLCIYLLDKSGNFASSLNDSNNYNLNVTSSYLGEGNHSTNLLLLVGDDGSEISTSEGTLSFFNFKTLYTKNLFIPSSKTVSLSLGISVNDDTSKVVIYTYSTNSSVTVNNTKNLRFVFLLSDSPIVIKVPSGSMKFDERNTVWTYLWRQLP